VKIVARAEDVMNLHFFPGLFSTRPTISDTGEILGERIADEREPLEIENVPVSPTAFVRWRPQLIGRQPVTEQELGAIGNWREEQGG
jgi:hypothetical protein